jgi:hypothetical protein
MSYLAIVADEEYHADLAAVLERLRQDWPDAAVTFSGDPAEAPHPTHGLVWEYLRGGAALDANVDVAGQCLYLDGVPELVAEYAAWFRAFVPAALDMVFCDDEYSFEQQLQPGVSSEELLDQLC